MELQHKQEGRHGTFYIEDNGKKAGMMVYAMTNPHKMVIEHTEVDEAYGGKGLGMQLVKAGVEYARANDIKILPLCVFAKKVFDKTEEFKDVLF